MAYTLELTESEYLDICFVGYRYFWSNALMKHCEVGVNEIAENVAWAIAESFQADTEGNHNAFPMLDGRSELADKLYRFWDSIV